MNERIKTIYEQARRLTAEEQLELSEMLAAVALPEKDIEEAWREEIEDRLTALDRGEARLVPAAQVLAKLRQP